jgi:hypothetical protein
MRLASEHASGEKKRFMKHLPHFVLSDILFASLASRRQAIFIRHGT